jgi:hypothetical protein
MPMITVFLLAAAVQAPAPPSPARVAQAKTLLRRQAEEQRTAIDAAIKHDLLGGGYFRLVTDKREQRSVVAGLQKRLRSIGIPASVGKCDWIGLVAQGFKDGNLSYGAACRVRIASQAPADFLICDASLGGVSLVAPDLFFSEPDYIEILIRRTCL